jgi:hypothetical protein
MEPISRVSKHEVEIEESAAESPIWKLATRRLLRSGGKSILPSKLNISSHSPPRKLKFSNFLGRADHIELVQ